MNQEKKGEENYANSYKIPHYEHKSINSVRILIIVLQRRKNSVSTNVNGINRNILDHLTIVPELPNYRSHA